jgi:murein lipoprotein
MLKKITAVTLALALTACSNTDALDANISSLTSKVDALSAQVTDLEAQQQSTATDAQAAKVAALIMLSLHTRNNHYYYLLIKLVSDIKKAPKVLF